MSALPVAPTWFVREKVSDVLTRVREPHVKPLLAANIWVLHGRDRDLVVDSGLGVASLRTHLPAIFERNPLLLVTHGHLDHLGGAHEFEDVYAHRDERIDRPGQGSLRPHVLRAVLGAPDGAFGHGPLITALPTPDYEWQSYALRPIIPSHAVTDGEVIDLGDLQLQVLHLPGHTPGSIGLYEPEQKILFSGDVVYDDEMMIDFLAESSPTDYRATMRRLLELQVDLVVPGHGDCFGPRRLAEVAERYLHEVERLGPP